MRLQNFKQDIIKIHRYCMKYGYPFLSSLIKVLQLRKERNVSLWYIINCDLLNHRKLSSVMLNDEYIAKAIEINCEKNLKLLKDKSILIKRCPNLLKRDVLLLEEATPEEIDNFFSKHTRFVAKINFSCCAIGFYIKSLLNNSKFTEVLKIASIKSQNLLLFSND